MGMKHEQRSRGLTTLKGGVRNVEVLLSTSVTEFLLHSTHTQVSVLTDQVEAQGVKISDLESSLEEHQHKLNSTEEMLQQVRTSHTGPLPFIQTFELQPYSQSQFRLASV